MIYTVWCDYGSEGWKPNEFDNEEAVIEFIMSGETHQPFRITKEIGLNVEECI